MWKKILVLIILFINVKNWPLAFHVRFYYQVFRHFYISRKVKTSSVFQQRVFTTLTPLMEMDFNLHKSNSTYFTDMDIARSDLMMHVFKDFFLKYGDRKIWPYTPLGSVMAVFRHEITPYVPYNIKSRVLGWDDKWIFVISRFETFQGKLCSVGLSKYVFKLRRKTVPVSEVVKFCGLDSPGVLERGKMDFQQAKDYLNLEKDLTDVDAPAKSN